jgi:opacity protein-like surface antigen
MRRTLVLLVAVLLMIQTGSAFAQGAAKFEITGLAGYRWGGGMSSIPNIRDFDTKDNWSFGIGLGALMEPGDKSVDVTWTHFSGDVTARTNGGIALSGGPLHRDDILLNGYFYYNHGSDVRPFITGGLGTSVFGSSTTNTVWRFGWSIGAGIRKEMSEKVALRLQGLWLPVWVSTGTGLWCDPFFCYTADTGEFYDQFELSAGIILKP